MNTFSSTDVRVVKLLADGRMYIGGDFLKIGSNTNLKNIARLMPNGLPDPSFTPPVFSNSFGRVNAITIMDDGKIAIGGSNLQLPLETSTRAIMRLNADGSYDASFNGGNPGFDVNNNPVIEGMFKSASNQLIVWGSFFNYNALSRRSLVALTLDGALVTPNPYASLPANFIVPDKVTEQPNGRLLITGDFTYAAGSIVYNRLFRLNANGSVDLNFRVGTGFQALNGAMLTVFGANLVDDAILVGDKLIVCGGFTDFNGVARNRMARINLGDVITPVTWLSFTATPTNSGALLQWRTASEDQNRGFDVQRSSDGQNYTTIGFVAAAGNGSSTQPSSYSFTDVTPIEGIVYYRLKQLDKDGGFEYSSVKTIRNAKSTSFKIVPTLANSSIQLQWPVVAAGVRTATVYNAAGKQISTVTLSQNNQKLYVGHLPAGSYYVQLQTPQGVETARFIKQ
ncbi:MAG: T9SS C-terminal target domain-containing protein [Bacteroidetes bacterium]|nr:MAG: T9SS C-terminal target domain-containing protein [Bacteroidota bacterium]